MKTKLFLIPFAIVLFAVFVAAASVTTSLFYDSTSENSLTITYGDDVGIIVSADSIFESSMTIEVDLLDDSGDVIENLLDVYTTGDSYFNDIGIDSSVYGAAGDYTIVSTVT